MFIAGDSESNSCGVVLDIQTPQEYAKFVFQAPRPYHLFVLFTMKGCCNIRRGHCNKSCGRAEASFRTVAARWASRRYPGRLKAERRVGGCATRVLHGAIGTRHMLHLKGCVCLGARLGRHRPRVGLRIRRSLLRRMCRGGCCGWGTR